MYCTVKLDNKTPEDLRQEQLADPEVSKIIFDFEAAPMHENVLPAGASCQNDVLYRSNRQQCNALQSLNRDKLPKPSSPHPLEQYTVSL